MANSEELRVDALERWREQNPLRLWRLRQPPEGWSRSVLARQLKILHTNLALWERGKSLPLLDHFLKISELTGISVKQWMNWYNQKPKVEFADRLGSGLRIAECECRRPSDEAVVA